MWAKKIWCQGSLILETNLQKKCHITILTIVSLGKIPERGLQCQGLRAKEVHESAIFFVSTQKNGRGYQNKLSLVK